MAQSYLTCMGDAGKNIQYRFLTHEHVHSFPCCVRYFLMFLTKEAYGKKGYFDLWFKRVWCIMAGECEVVGHNIFIFRKQTEKNDCA